MNYTNIVKGIFISRPNRFIAHVLVRLPDSREQEVICHVKNTGRCKELLLPGVTVFCEHHPDAALLGRKTEYSLIGVCKNRSSEGKPPLLINMDSQAPNAAAYEWLQTVDTGRITGIRREVTYGQSRFDLAFDVTDHSGDSQCQEGKRRCGFMEVKGVTLEDRGIASFPDAPTERGIKHIHELIHAAENGYIACILFVIQLKEMREFRPNRKTHPQFGDALKEAALAGVHILAYDCLITENSMTIDSPVSVNLDL